MPEDLERLREDGVRIVGGGDPERGVERRAIEQPGGGLGIHGPDHAPRPTETLPLDIDTVSVGSGADDEDADFFTSVVESPHAAHAPSAEHDLDTFLALGESTMDFAGLNNSKTSLSHFDIPPTRSASSSFSSDLPRHPPSSTPHLHDDSRRATSSFSGSLPVATLVALPSRSPSASPPQRPPVCLRSSRAGSLLLLRRVVLRVLLVVLRVACCRRQRRPPPQRYHHHHQRYPHRHHRRHRRRRRRVWDEKRSCSCWT